MNEYTLDMLDTGLSGRVVQVKGKGASRRRILEMGMVPGAIINVTKKAPLGDPVDFKLKGYNLSLRKKEAQMVVVVPMEE